MSLSWWFFYLAPPALLIGLGVVLTGPAQGAAELALSRLRLDPNAKRLLVNLVRPGILAVALTAALALLGVPTESLSLVIGAVALGLMLAIRPALSNLSAGALLLTSRPFHGGDLVEIGGLRGEVVSQDLSTTRLRTENGELLTLSSTAVWAGPILNLSRAEAGRIALSFYLRPDADLAKARAALLAVCAAEAELLASPAPALSLADVQPGALHVSLEAWAKPAGLSALSPRLREASLLALRDARLIAVHPS